MLYLLVPSFSLSSDATWRLREHPLYYIIEPNSLILARPSRFHANRPTRPFLVLVLFQHCNTDPTGDLVVLTPLKHVVWFSRGRPKFHLILSLTFCLFTLLLYFFCFNQILEFTIEEHEFSFRPCWTFYSFRSRICDPRCKLAKTAELLFLALGKQHRTIWKLISKLIHLPVLHSSITLYEKVVTRKYFYPINPIYKTNVGHQKYNNYLYLLLSF